MGSLSAQVSGRDSHVSYRSGHSFHASPCHRSSGACPLPSTALGTLGLPKSRRSPSRAVARARALPSSALVPYTMCNYCLKGTVQASGRLSSQLYAHHLFRGARSGRRTQPWSLRSAYFTRPQLRGLGAWESDVASRSEVRTVRVTIVCYRYGSDPYRYP